MEYAIGSIAVLVGGRMLGWFERRSDARIICSVAGILMLVGMMQNV